jgi:magnesium transporter
VKVDNPVSSEFLSRHPSEAARVLEHISPEDVAALFGQLSSETIIPVLVAMLPDMAAACLGKMEAHHAAKLLTEISLPRAAHIYRQISPTTQKELSDHLSYKIRNRIHRFLDYAPLSAGDLMSHTVTMLFDELTVADAIRRIERIRHTVSCEIFVIDSKHSLLGVIELGRLVTSDHHKKLRDMITKKPNSVSVNANLEKLLTHSGWATQHRLPVVERDNTLVGVLDYTRLQEATGDRTISHHDPMENLLSLAGLYWVSLIQLLDSVLSIARTGKGERR